jgi:hypothetical protein
MIGTSSGATVSTLTGTGMFGGICEEAGVLAGPLVIMIAALNAASAFVNILLGILEVLRCGLPMACAT